MSREKRTFLRLGLAFLLCSSGIQSSRSAPAEHASLLAEAAESKGVVRRWIDEGFNQHEPRVVDEVFVESFAINGQVMTREDLKQSMRRRLTAFPDLHVRIDELVGEGGTVAVWYTAEGTHKAEFEGISATGRHVTWSGADVVRVEGGRIRQGRFVDDSLGLMRQLGATLVPPPQK